MSEFKKWRVTWVPVVKSTVCWRETEAQARDYVADVLAARGVEYGEMWVVEEPELWGHVFGEEDAKGLIDGERRAG